MQPSITKVDNAHALTISHIWRSTIIYDHLKIFNDLAKSWENLYYKYSYHSWNSVQYNHILTRATFFLMISSSSIKSKINTFPLFILCNTSSKTTDKSGFLIVFPPHPSPDKLQRTEKSSYHSVQQDKLARQRRARRTFCCLLWPLAF